ALGLLGGGPFGPPAGPEHRERRERRRSGDADAPPEAAQVAVPADQPVEREARPAGRGERDRGRRDQQVELEPAGRVPEAVLRVHGRDRDEHHRGDRERRERRQEAEREAEAAQELGQRGRERDREGGAEAHAAEPAGGAAQAGAAPPAEELLRAVRRDRGAEHGAEEQDSVGQVLLTSFPRRIFVDASITTSRRPGSFPPASARQGAGRRYGPGATPGAVSRR